MDLGTGEYMARFMAPTAGAYQVSIRHKSSNIAGSPFPAEVLPSAIAADCSYVVQEGLEKAVSGQQVTGFTNRRDSLTRARPSILSSCIDPDAKDATTHSPRHLCLHPALCHLCSPSSMSSHYAQFCIPQTTQGAATWLCSRERRCSM